MTVPGYVGNMNENVFKYKQKIVLCGLHNFEHLNFHLLRIQNDFLFLLITVKYFLYRTQKTLKIFLKKINYIAVASQNT